MVRPKTLSASSLQTASNCMRRYIAENMKYARAIPNNAAMTGSTCHYALENYVRDVYVDKIDVPDHEAALITYLKAGYTDTFGDTNYESAEYKDAEIMVLNWLAMADFRGREVISLEKKDRYQLPLKDGTTMPITYIWDRCDRLDDGSIVVVDYKSNRFNIGEDELHKKIQAKLYALIAMILYPESEYIRVEFHMLRHGVTSTTFTRADCADTWRWLNAEVKRILDTDPADVKPTLNNECNFCVVKSSCSAIRTNIEVGGIFSASPAELVDLAYQLQSQIAGAKAAFAEVEDVLGPLLRPADGLDLEIEGTTHTASVEARTVRTVDTDMVTRMISSDPELIEDYLPRGKITMGSFDNLLKDDRVDPALRKNLRGLVGKKVQEPKIKLEKK